MNSYQKICRLLSKYSFTIDTGDLEGYAALFKYGELRMEGMEPFIGQEQCLASTKAVIIYEDGTPKTKHVTSNISLEIDDEKGVATGQSYVTIFQQTDNFPLQAIFSGHYFDEFIRKEGEWHFKKRHIKHPLIGDMSAHLKMANE